MSSRSLTKWQLTMYCHLKLPVPPVVPGFDLEAVHQRTKFQQNGTIRGWFIATEPFPIWTPSNIWDFPNDSALSTDQTRIAPTQQTSNFRFVVLLWSGGKTQCIFPMKTEDIFCLTVKTTKCFQKLKVTLWIELLHDATATEKFDVGAQLHYLVCAMVLKVG